MATGTTGTFAPRTTRAAPPSIGPISPSSVREPSGKMFRAWPPLRRLIASLTAPAALPPWRTGNAPSERISHVKAGLTSNSSLLAM